MQRERGAASAKDALMTEKVLREITARLWLHNDTCTMEDMAPVAL